MQIVIIVVNALFLSTLSLRRATSRTKSNRRPLRFLSTLSLRRATGISGPRICSGRLFLSTLSLRRATARRGRGPGEHIHFYPRSPCGERQQVTFWQDIDERISIHALLAESDHQQKCCNRKTDINFYPRSPCGERRYRNRAFAHSEQFLSTLSLRRATR